jgi:hypothetical protein
VRSLAPVGVALDIPSDTQRNSSRKNTTMEPAFVRQAGAFSQRRLPENATLDSILRELLSFLSDWLAAHKLTAKDLVIQAACGKLAQILWSEPELLSLRDRIQSILARGGFPIRSDPKDVPQVIQLRLLQALLAASGDPESYVLDWYALGSLWLGVDQRLPRAPAIFERKVHWRLQPVDRPEQAVWAENYVSATERPDVLLKQFEADEAEGMMVRVPSSVAASTYGSKLAVASQGALLKSLDKDEHRVIHDGTFKVLVNHSIRVR